VEQKYTSVRNEVPAIFIRMYSDKHQIKIAHIDYKIFLHSKENHATLVVKNGRVK
jgi:nucleoside phosphorylase